MKYVSSLQSWDSLWTENFQMIVLPEKYATSKDKIETFLGHNQVIQDYLFYKET